MPQYIYECECGYQKIIVHGIKKDPIVKCEKCSDECYRVIQPVETIIKGNCYLNKADCKKQSNLSLLNESDPYAKYRLPGEKEDLVNKIKKGNKKKISVPVNGTKS